nr:response regulator transcription factor [Paenibacillus beijingensis]
MGIKIVVADDETNITDVCKRYLEREGYEVLTAANGDEALSLWKAHAPMLLILDLMMPQKDGWQVCQSVRDEDDVPIIILTARSEEPDRLAGLTMGADDYMTKPFSPRELVLRVKAILRRYRVPARELAEKPEAPQALDFGGLVINPSTRLVNISGKTIELTVKEFELLYLMARHPEQVFSRTQLLNKIWDISFEGDTTTVTVHVRRLREKIEPVPSEPKYIKTVWGIGYKFEGRGLS